MSRPVIALCTLLLAGCAQTSTIPLAANTVQITSRAAPACGAEGAERMAFRQAAVETINRGFDSFVILNGQYQGDTFVAGYTPVQAYSSGTAHVNSFGNSATVYGNTTTTYTGGQPITMTRHSQGLIVRMFKDGDPAAANALSARDSLGPEWSKIVREKNYTCLS